MTMPRIAPMPMKGTQRRRQSFDPASKNMRVPLWTPEVDGQEFDGVIRVPVRLCNTPEHTNDRLQFNGLIIANLQRWVEWRRLRGWIITDKPVVTGPFDPPENERAGYLNHAVKRIGKAREAEATDYQDYPEEIKWYIAKARFKRDEPVYVRLEDHLFLRHLANLYDVDPDRDPPTVTDLPEPKDEIEVQGGVNLMEVAEERRQMLGVKRKDYLMGKLWEPL